MAQIDAVTQRLSDLKSESAELQITENDLLFQLAKVRISKRRLHEEIFKVIEVVKINNSNMPIGRLSNDVLVEIFGLLRGGRPNGIPALVQASHVISRWRALALSTPALWSTIDIRSTNSHSTYRQELNQEYIARSGACLLDIYVYIGAGQTTNPIMELLVPQINRWRHLYIESKYEDAVLTIIKRLQRLSAPCLKSLQIELDIDNEQQEVLWLGGNHTFSGGVPALSSIELRGINLHQWLPVLGGVKSIYMADCYSATMLRFCDLRKILAAATSLTHLELEGMVNCFSDDDVTVIEMPYLVSLIVLPPDYINPINYMRNIFTTISAPSLQILCLRKVYGLQFHTFLEIFQSVSRYPVLQTLRLESVTGLEYLAPSFALSSPTITHLSLKFTDSEPILKLLLSNAHDPLWPRLKTLSVGPVDLALLRSFISGRISTGRPLSILRYGTESRAAFDDLPRDELNWLRERLQVENVSFHDI